MGSAWVLREKSQMTYCQDSLPVFESEWEVMLTMLSGVSSYENSVFCLFFHIRQGTATAPKNLFCPAVTEALCAGAWDCGSLTLSIKHILETCCLSFLFCQSYSCINQDHALGKVRH